MKSQDPKNLRAKTGVSRLWLGVAAVVGAAVAYLGVLDAFLELEPDFVPPG